MHRLSLALAATATALTLAAPAGAAQGPSPCHRTAAAPRVVATRTSTAVGRAAIVACDRARGRRVTLRRGFVGDSGRHLPLLGSPAVQGTKVIWSELVGSAQHPRQDLRSADVRHATRQAHRRIGPQPHPDPFLSSDQLGVLALPGGALAYEVTGPDQPALVLARPGHAARTLAPAVDDEQVEDGRTLVWLAESGAGSYDVRPVPRDAGGCPIRSRYATVVRDTPELRVTVADYGFGTDGDIKAYRVCSKETGRDGIAFTSDPLILLEDRIATQGPFVALPEAANNKYQQCPNDTTQASVLVIDARTGRKLQPALSDNHSCVDVRSVAVSTTGVPAWLGADEQGALRIATPPAPGSRSATVLDSGPAGSLAGLAASPSGGFTWTHDSAPRASQ
ncbi:hypothetical protein [Conexibacter woesei]|uniref:hypothetical protein n=1 Tax=Conexibacter woesei TaxID=191495 RepID=UPI0004279325|nr:hypothetical protein [Conexibacter woesei]